MKVVISVLGVLGVVGILGLYLVAGGRLGTRRPTTVNLVVSDAALFRNRCIAVAVDPFGVPVDGPGTQLDLVVTPDGVCKVANIDFTGRWMKYQLTDQSTGVGSAPPDVVELWTVAVFDNKSWFFLGTQSEYDAALRRDLVAGPYRFRTH